MADYRVEPYMDDQYQVLEKEAGHDEGCGCPDEVVFKGSITECEAFIRLKENGYM